MLINSENIFLIILAIIWITGAVLQDLKRREVDNLWNFSLIFIALAYRASVSAFTGNNWFIINGLIGLALFFILQNIFYYSRLFAGGDAKLLMALGPILPFSYSWAINFKIFGYFILLFMVCGSIYALLYSIGLTIKYHKNFSREIFKQLKMHKKIFIFSLIFAIIWFIFGSLIDIKLGFIGIIVLLFPVLFTFAKAVEESCLIREVHSSNITIGDWLYKDIIVNGKKIKASWDGISSRELKQIRKSKKRYKIKYGIPFTPSFLFGFLSLLYLFWKYGHLF